jgi:hypothetical protein
MVWMDRVWMDRVWMERQMSDFHDNFSNFSPSEQARDEAETGAENNGHLGWWFGRGQCRQANMSCAIPWTAFPCYFLK